MNNKCGQCVHEKICGIKTGYMSLQVGVNDIANKIPNIQEHFQVNVICKNFKPIDITTSFIKPRSDNIKL